MALSVAERINKRAFYPCKLPNGETVHLRGLKHSVLAVAKTFEHEAESVGFAIGKSLVNDSGQPEYQQGETESPQDFGARVLSELHDMGPDVQGVIIDRIFVITNEPSKVQHEAIVKNS